MPPTCFIARSALALGASLTLVACSTPNEGGASPGDAPIVIGSSFTIESEVLGKGRAVHVCLPWGYAEREERFPVLYLIDGGVQQDLVPVVGFQALATLSAQYREFIVVGVETENRRFELTTPSEVAYDLELIPSNGGAEDFRRFLVEELRPWVDSSYRTSGEDVVLGESLAGLFIVDTFLRAPASFDSYIAVSPSLWWNEGSLALSAAEHLRAQGFPAGRSLFLTVADEADIQEGMRPLVAALEAHAPAGLSWWFQPMPEEHHHTIYHPATLVALRLVFGGAADS